MKKIVLFSAVAALSLTLALNSCKKDNPISCTQRAIDVTNAAQNYANDPSSANCITYKNAINDYLECDIVTQTQKDSYELILDGLAC